MRGIASIPQKTVEAFQQPRFAQKIPKDNAGRVLPQSHP
jgi:hypothetical protein